jgi:hypothetical protein
MSRTIEEIKQEIEDKRQSFAELNSMNSSSLTAVFRVIESVYVAAMFAAEKLRDFFKEEVEVLVAQKQAPTLRWYQELAKSYLHGKPLVWNSETLKWEQQLSAGELASDFQVTDYAAAVKSPGKITIKVAKEVSGSPAPLSTPEKAGFDSYMAKMQAAGDYVEVLSDDPDDIQIVVDVRIDPLVINQNNGQLHSDASVIPVELAVNDYLKNLEFNGEFIVNRFIDSIQSAQGVINPETVTINSRYGALPYSPITIKEVANSGYYAIDLLTVNYLT